MWNNWDDMFPTGVAHSDDFGVITKDFAIANQLAKITTIYIKPARNILDNQIKYTWYENGDFTAEYIYNAYPIQSVDNIPLLNIYGQKIASNTNET